MINESIEYLEYNHVSFESKRVTGSSVDISPRDIVEVVKGTNEYLLALQKLFDEMSFRFYETLEQRNLSGFIGEVFGRVFTSKIKNFVSNPHADGRPDLLDLSTCEAETYFYNYCLLDAGNARMIPNKSLLAPFAYGGLEVKATIGSPRSNFKISLQADRGVRKFDVGIPRIPYIGSLTYWGHHTSCENLLGLYYDYFEELNGVPQVVAVMHACLDPEHDWHIVSTGKVDSKKTSNTSLTQQGLKKLLDCPVIVRNHSTYLSRLRQIGLKI